jgi:hypothetical protein
MIAETIPGKFGIEVKNAGILYLAQSLYTIIVFGLSFILMWINSYHINDLQKKKQVNLIIYSAITALIIGFIGAIIPQIAGSNLLAPLAITIFAALTFFIIAKHSLFDVRLIVARSIAYTTSIVAIIIIYSLLVFTVAKYIFGIELTMAQEIFFATLSAVIAIVYKPVRVFSS